MWWCGIQEFFSRDNFLSSIPTSSLVKISQGRYQVFSPSTSTTSTKELNMYHHKLESEFMPVIYDEVFIRYVFNKLFVHTKNTKDLISNFESTQQVRVSEDLNNWIVNYNHHQIYQWDSDIVWFSLEQQSYTDWESKYAYFASIMWTYPNSLSSNNMEFLCLHWKIHEIYSTCLKALISITLKKSWLKRDIKWQG